MFPPLLFVLNCTVCLFLAAAQQMMITMAVGLAPHLPHPDSGQIIIHLVVLAVAVVSLQMILAMQIEIKELALAPLSVEMLVDFGLALLLVDYSDICSEIASKFYLVVF